MARRPVYVYSLEGSAGDLKQWAEAHLGEPVWHWVADPARLDPGEGLPADWKEQGSVFNERGELRWWRRDGIYEAVLVTERPAGDLPPLPGVWEADIQAVLLQNLDDRRVNPNFTTYPFGRPDGKVEVQICYRDGVAMLVSLRRFLQTEEE